MSEGRAQKAEGKKTLHCDENAEDGYDQDLDGSTISLGKPYSTARETLTSYRTHARTRCAMFLASLSRSPAEHACTIGLNTMSAITSRQCQALISSSSPNLAAIGVAKRLKRASDLRGRSRRALWWQKKWDHDREDWWATSVCPPDLPRPPSDHCSREGQCPEKSWLLLEWMEFLHLLILGMKSGFNVAILRAWKRPSELGRPDPSTDFRWRPRALHFSAKSR